MKARHPRSHGEPPIHPRVPAKLLQLFVPRDRQIPNERPLRTIRRTAFTPVTHRAAFTPKTGAAPSHSDARACHGSRATHCAAPSNSGNASESAATPHTESARRRAVPACSSREPANSAAAPRTAERRTPLPGAFVMRTKHPQARTRARERTRQAQEHQAPNPHLSRRRWWEGGVKCGVLADIAESIARPSRTQGSRGEHLRHDESWPGWGHPSPSTPSSSNSAPSPAKERTHPHRRSRRSTRSRCSQSRPRSAVLHTSGVERCARYRGR
jgi:hypothetical protein